MKNLYLITTLFGFLFFASFTHAQSIEDKYPVTVLNPTGTKQLVFYFTGDGGINTFSEKFCDGLAQKNYTVICFNARKYFWKQKTPELMASQVTEIIRYYLNKFNKKEYSLIGYSFGADAVIYLANRLPKNLSPLLKSTVLLSPSLATDFTVKFVDLLGIESSEGKYKTLPEILKLMGPILCVFGDQEQKTFANGIVNKRNIRKILLPGSHKYDNNTNAVITAVLTVL